LIIRSPFRNPCGRGTLLFFAALLYVPLAKAQGAAPETAPPLFPGGGLISYSSNFNTRGVIPESQGGIPATARPTCAHEGDFNFTWGFHANFDLTVLVPVVTNHFRMQSASTVGGTGIGDVMALVKYRFYRRDSQRGTTQASVTVGPKIPTLCSPVQGPPTSFSLRTGLTPGFLIFAVLWLMKIFVPCCAQKERNRLGSEATSNLASGSRIDLMSRRTLLVNGSSAPRSRGSILAMTELLESARLEAVARFYLQERQPMSGCAPECMSG
jgi:hypothetical protein